MSEIWKDIPKYEGLYQVSNFGNIKSLDKIVYRNVNGKVFPCKWKGRLMSPTKHRKYYYIGLPNKVLLVSRLVLSAFDPREDEKDLIADHINGDTFNNNLENLRWASYKVNNSNLPYTRYLQKLLEANNIEYQSIESWFN